MIGLVSWGHSNASGDDAKYITNLRDLKDFLKANGVEVEAAAPVPSAQATAGSTEGPGLQVSPTDQSSSSPLVPVLIGIIVLVVVGGGVAIFVLQRGKKNPPQSPPPTYGTPPTPPAVLGLHTPFGRSTPMALACASPPAQTKASLICV